MNEAENIVPNTAFEEHLKSQHTAERMPFHKHHSALSKEVEFISERVTGVLQYESSLEAVSDVFDATM